MMIVTLAVHSSTTNTELRPLMMTVVEVKFPLIVVVEAPEGMVMTVESTFPSNTHVPATQTNEGEGRVD